MTLTHEMLLSILIEAEERRDDQSLPKDVRDRSAETVALVEERMAKEKMSRGQLETLAKA